MSVDRVDPPFVADEATLLTGFLEYHRSTLLMKCDGLGPDELRRRSVEPSSLSLMGLVRHMSDVERGWFQRGVANQEAPGIYWSESNFDGDFDDVDRADIEADFATYREQCERSRQIVAAADSLDVTFTHKRHGEMSLRWVLIHMIEEYSRHNGHADFLRERIDGATGE